MFLSKTTEHIRRAVPAIVVMVMATTLAIPTTVVAADDYSPGGPWWNCVLYGTTFNSDGSVRCDRSLVEGTTRTAEDVVGLTVAGILVTVAVISFVILSIASILLWLGGVVFNWTIALLVFEFATYFGNSTGMLTAWGILRDLGNILLLFGFVYMGIQTILQIGHYSVGRALPRLIIFAILLNFSLFISEAVIDTANVLASTVYSQTYTAAQNGVACQGNLQECSLNGGIASIVIDRAGVLSVLSEESNRGLLAVVDYVGNPIGFTLKYLVLALLVVTAAVVLFAGAFLLISRGIHLVFLMVTSPIGFAGMAVPWLEKLAKDWWDQLLKQAMFAPVFLILLFVGFKILEGTQAIGGGGTLASAIGGSGTINTGPIIIFLLVIGFMIGAMLVAKQFGIYGAEAVTKWGTGVIGRVAGASTLGVAGWIARRTLGSASMAAGRSLRTGRLAGLGQMAVVGRMLTGVADAGAKASYDGRSGLKSVGPLDLGSASEAAKKGRRGELEAIVKRYSDHRKSMTEQDELEHNLAKMRYEELEEKIGAPAAAVAIARGTGNNADEKELIKQKAIMDNSVTGLKNTEKEKKEKFDETVSELKELGGKLDQIDKSLGGIGRELANPSISPERRASLDAQKSTLEDEKRDKEAQFANERTTYYRLANEIRGLRTTIADKESAYRKNVQKASNPNVAGLSPLDRRALREAALAMKKEPNESVFKPKNLDDALGKALRGRRGLP